MSVLPCAQGRSLNQFCSTLIAEISNSRVIFSDTSTPPVRSAAFHATLEHVTVSSGLVWSPDGGLAYHSLACRMKAVFGQMTQ
jgi:hypothetical protein